MSIWEKSLLLIRLRHRLEQERNVDWQTLHKRDRGWALEQTVQSLLQPWRLLSLWLQRWAESPSGGATLFVYVASLLSLMGGVLLMAGLLEYRPLQRINLLWFLVIAVLLPFLWWLLALISSRAQVPFPLRTLYERRLPEGRVSDALTRLLRVTVVALGQQLSLMFAIGMLLAFLFYLLLTDLAFGWASTLPLGSDLIHGITLSLAAPWQHLWPEAVPSLPLIEQTQHYRTAPVTESPQLYGAWWRFLLMCLLCYTLLPRVVTSIWWRLRLVRLQRRVRENDALISGLWQRLSSELIDQQAERVNQREAPSAKAELEERVGRYTQVLCWGRWQDEQIAPLHRRLAEELGGRWVAAADTATVAEALDILRELPDEPLLLLCKGWEPPTGELADLCERLAVERRRVFLWPVPLEGMQESRQQALIESWRAFMPQIPGAIHLIQGGGILEVTHG